MTEDIAPMEPMEVLPMPPGAIELPVDQPWAGDRALAIAALRQVLSSRGTGLPLGPETAAEEDGRLLNLNRFALQLCTSGISADQISVDARPWAAPATAPQLVLSALVDEENAVVAFGGVLTGAEFVATAATSERIGDQLLLDAKAFRGGVERLLILVQLLEPEALPRLALTSQPTAERLVVSVIDWLQGLLQPALEQLGGELLPLTAGAFRQAAIAADSPGASPLAILSIPLGLTTAGDLVSGEAAQDCIERFQLLLMPTAEGRSRPERLVLRLVGELSGDLLPDGLVLTAVQGSRRLSVSAALTTSLDLELPADTALIEVSITAPGGQVLVLPPLQLAG